MYEGIELAVFAPGDLTTPLTLIPRRWDPTLLEELNRDGGGSFRIRSDDQVLADYPTALLEGNLVRQVLNNGKVHWWEILNKQDIDVSEGEYAGEWKQVSGPGVRSWLSHAVVYPEYGLVDRPGDRAFNFASKQGPWYTAAEWVPATENGSVRLGNAIYAPLKEWPTKIDANWIWATSQTTAGATAPVGDVYFRQDFSMPTAAKVKIFATADDLAQLYMDGVQVMAITEWAASKKVFTVELDLTSGNHVFAAKVRNLGGAAGLAFALCKVRDGVDDDDKFLNTDRVIWSGTGLRVNAYPASPPGWTLGQILNTLLDEAEDRGVPSIARFTRTWTNSLDSNGTPWQGIVDKSFSLGASYTDVMTQLTDAYIDVWFDGLNMNIAPTRGVDRSVPLGGKDPVIFRAGLSVVGAEAESTAEIANVAVVNTAAGLVERSGPAESLSQFGRRESYLSATNSTEAGNAGALIEQLFQKFAQPRRTPTLRILPTDGAVPWVDFAVGDWVLAPSDDGGTDLIKRRIVSISVTEDAETGAEQYSAEIDTIQQTAEERLARWLQAVENGTKQGGVSGTSSSKGGADFGPTGPNTGTPPVPSLPNAANPTAPTNLTGSSDTYVDDSRVRRGRATLAWQHDGLDDSGRTNEVIRYEITYRATGSTDKWQTVVLDGTKTGVVAPLAVLKPDRSGIQSYTFAVRAISTTGRTSGWSQSIDLAMVKDTTAPARPYFVLANVTTWMRTITVRWNGKLTDAAGTAQTDPPPDFSHINVYQSSAGDGTGMTLVGRIPDQNSLWVTDKVTADVKLYFTLKAVDVAGNESLASEIKYATPTANVNAEEILAAIDAGKVTLTNVGAEAIKTGAILRDKLAQNAVDLGKLDTAVQSAIADGQTALSNQTGINQNITTLQTSVDGKTAIINAETDPVGNGKTDGDRWQRWDTLGPDGKLLKTWRWTGIVWRQELMDPTYLPQVDIGAGTFGSLNGSRLEVNSVLAKMLSVTDPTNFAPSPAESPGDWILTGGMTIVNNSSISVSGSRFEAVGNTSTAWAYGPMKAVTPGEKLYAAATVYRSTSTNTTAAFLRFQWYDKNKATLTSPQYTGTQTTGLSGTRMELVAEVPAGAAYAILTLPIVTAGVGNETLRTSLYDVEGRRQTGSVYIADGAVVADKVATNALTARTLLIGDYANLALGGDFEDSKAVPFGLHPDHTITTSNKKSGTSSLRLGPGAAGNRASYFTGDSRVREGEQWYFSYWVLIDSSFNGDSNSKLRVGASDGTHLMSIPYNGNARSVWVKMDGTVTIPAGVTSLSIGLWSTNTAGTAYIDDVQIRRVAEASLIQNLGVEKLVVGTGSMDSAVIDTLWTKVVRSQSITTDMLVVGAGQNLVVDPTGADVKLRNARLAESTSVSYGATWTWGISGGRAEWKTNPTAADPTKNVALRMISYEGGTTYSTPVEAGQEYVVRFSAYRVSGGLASVRSVYRVRNTDGSVINAGDAGNADGTNGTYFVLQPGWNTVERRYTMPDTAKTASIDIEIQAGATATNVAIRDVFLGMKNSASLIVDGAILTRHLTVTEDMTVALLKAHKVEAIEIDTNDLSSDTGFVGSLKTGILTADSITSTMIHATGGITSKHTITGATIQTDATANRGIKLAGGYLRAYTASGAETFSIAGPTGAVVGTGEWRTGTSGNYITMKGDTNGGILKFFTGNGSGRGSLWARSVSGGDDRISMAFGNLDEPTGTLPVVVATATASYLNYGSRTIKTWNNGGVEELLLDATDAAVILRGNLDMRDGRTTYRFGAANTLAYVGQRVESGSTPDFEIKALQGGIRFGGYLQSLSTYGRTSTSGANMVVDSAGEIYRSSSASRYKLDQRPLAVSPSALDVKMKDWVDKAQVERYNELTALPKPVLEDQQQAIDSIDLRRIPGLIAEDLVAAGQDQYVIFGPDGQTEGVMYDRFAFAQIAALNDKLDKALERIAVLEGI